VSLSLGARYIDSKKGGDGAITVNNFAFDAVPEQTANIDFSKEATGWSGVLGVNLSPTDRLNIGLRYEMSTKLDYEDKVSQDNMGLLQNLGISDGNKTRYDLPAVFGLGVAHKITPDLTTHVTLTYYFQESADWNGAEDNVENGYDLGIAFEYDVNDKLKASLGYLYTDTGLDAENMTPEMPELNASTIGGGVAYTLAPGLDLNFGAGFVFCQDDSFVNTATGAEIEYRKDILFLAFGIQYKFM
jgi:long-chain fatty acid transport protein